MTKFKQLGAAAVLAFAVIGLLHLRSCVREKLGTSTAPKVGASHSPLLPKVDKEVVRVSMARHAITVQTATKTTMRYVRAPVIEIRKDGTTRVESKNYGLEFSPAIGVGYGPGTRLQLAVGFAYVYRFDANVHLSIAHDGRVQPLFSLSYNVWSNSGVYFGLDPVDMLLGQKPSYCAGILVRL